MSLTNTVFGALRREQARERSGDLVVIPTGAVEQHGPHLPVGTDIMIARAIVRDASARVARAHALDLLGFGCSGHHMSFGGTVSLHPETFVRVIVDGIESLCASGFIPVFVNGHGGNRGPLGTALQSAMEYGHRAYAMTYFDLIGSEIVEEFGSGTSLGHACALETSLVLHLWPQLVGDEIPGLSGDGLFPDASLFGADQVVCHRHFQKLSSIGVVGDPSLGSADAGATLYAKAVDAVTDRLRKILSLTDERVPDEGLTREK